ncbi:MAG: FAD-binding oxidoreductase [Deltaproteobacteria bacterium]|jgi:D-lactate dehydrogenase (cytochrome)|nr:FAD-binding oxidoreductase [Deltaproteobacteria bacterium]
MTKKKSTSPPPPPSGPSSCLRDESRLEGFASEIKNPADHRTFLDLARKCLARGEPMTFQGARTGLAGGAVPQGGTAVGLGALDRPVALERGPEGFELLVQPGYTLAALRRDLARRKFDFISPGRASRAEKVLAEFQRGSYFWPPDPGEAAATLGGAASTNAAGPNAGFRGPAGGHIAGLNFLFSDGEERSVRRGEHVFREGALRLPDGRTLEAAPPALGLPPPADLTDILIGSQGMYGAVTGVRLRLSPAPAHVWGLVFFAGSEQKAAAFMELFLASPPEPLVSLDYLDKASLDVVAAMRRTASRLAEIPGLPETAGGAVLAEFQSMDEGLIEQASLAALRFCQEAGLDPDDSWALTDAETDKMRVLRHAVPEGLGGRLDRVRAKGCPALRMSTDFTVPGRGLGELLSEYRRDLEGGELSAVVFGHAKDNHLHVNIIPENDSQVVRAGELMRHWLERAKKARGGLFVEHGVGKLRRELFLEVESPERIAALRSLKKTMDPNNLFNPGNMFA